MAATNSVFANDTAITLDWANVTGADLYHLQVATAPDFSGTLIVNDSALAVSTKSFTDTGTDNTKRWWRWRSSTDTGATWSVWSEVGSFWINTGGAGDVTLTAENWAMFDTDPVTDIYTFTLFPVYIVVPMHQKRIRERNRVGTLLSEYITLKDKISFQFDESHYIQHPQMREFRRFNSEIKTFFLATYKSNIVDDVQNIWKVEFQIDPELSMLPSRQDLFTGTLEFEEV